MKKRNILALSVANLAFAPFSFATAPASTYVAVNGIDTNSCGGRGNPCRTITRALANAPSGGSVAVGPGIYGDVDGNTQLFGPEEESGTAAAVISITKPVRLYSTDGAAVTTIEGGFSRLNVVQIESSQVIFGGHDAGFTITGGTNAGLVAIGVDKVSVIGNAALKNGAYGIGLFSSGVVRAWENYAVQNGTQGFVASVGQPRGYVILTNNVSIANAGDGFQTTGANSPHQLLFNVASGNNAGVLVGPGPSRIYGNTLSGNNSGITLGDGPLDTLAAGPVVVRNNILGSKAAGVVVATFESPTTASLRENNIFGTAVSLEYLVGCGVLNNTVTVLDARNNYWGAPSGPGVKPADSACNGPVISTPFATRPFNIR